MNIVSALLSAPSAPLSAPSSAASAGGNGAGNTATTNTAPNTPSAAPSVANSKASSKDNSSNNASNNANNDSNPTQQSDQSNQAPSRAGDQSSQATQANQAPQQAQPDNSSTQTQGESFSQMLASLQQVADANAPVTAPIATVPNLQEGNTGAIKKQKDETKNTAATDNSSSNQAQLVNAMMAALMAPVPVVQPVPTTANNADNISVIDSNNASNSGALSPADQAMLQQILKQIRDNATSGDTAAATTTMQDLASTQDAANTSVMQDTASTNDAALKAALQALSQTAADASAMQNAPVILPQDIVAQQNNNMPVAPVVYAQTNSTPTINQVASMSTPSDQNTILNTQNIAPVQTNAAPAVVQDNAATTTPLDAAIAAAKTATEKNNAAQAAANPGVTVTTAQDKAPVDQKNTQPKDNSKLDVTADNGPAIEKLHKDTDSNTKDNTENDDKGSSSLLGDASLKQSTTDKTSSATKPVFTLTPQAIPSPADQIKVSITKMVTSGDGQISIHLKPGELGHVDIRMNLTADGKTTIHIAAEKQDTLNLLQKDVSHLEKSLRDVGIKSEGSSLNFSLRDGSSQQGRHSQQQQGFTSNYSENGSEDGTDTASIKAVRHYTGYITMNSGLDISV